MSEFGQGSNVFVVVVFQVLIELKSRYLPCQSSYLNARVVSILHFLVVVQLRSPLSCQLSAKAPTPRPGGFSQSCPLSSLLPGQKQQISLILLLLLIRSSNEVKSTQDGLPFDILSHSLVLPTLEEGVIQSVKPRNRNPGTILKSSLPHSLS